MSNQIQSAISEHSAADFPSEGVQANGNPQSKILSKGRGEVSSKIFLAFGALTLIVAAGLKIWLLLGERLPFNADEAIVGLMARHIIQGDLPVFFYGQAYMGSLDAFLVAGIFWLFEEAVWGIRAVQVMLYLGTVVTAMLLAYRIFGSRTAAAATGWLLAIPAVNLTLYTTVSLGNYGEALLIGNLILLASLRIADKIMANLPMSRTLWLVFGLLVGVGFWSFGLTLVYSVPAAVFIGSFLFKPEYRQLDRWWRKIARSFGLASLGFIMGSMPFWVYTIQNGLSTMVQELGGTAVAGVEGLNFAGQILQHSINFILFGTTAMFGLRPPWEVRWLALPLLPFILIFWAGTLLFIINSIRRDKPIRPGLLLLLGVGSLLILTFVVSPFGADPSGRYFLPLMVILAVFAGGLIHFLTTRYGLLAWGLLGLISLFHLWGNVDAGFRTPPGVTTQFDPVTQVDHSYDAALIAFLSSQGFTQGYSNYWVSYPLAFLSEESIIFNPSLPYHPDFRYTERDNRYQPYQQMVEMSENPTYITTNHPGLDEHIRKSFSSLGVIWIEQKIGDYQIFHSLSRAVKPTDLGLGRTSE